MRQAWVNIPKSVIQQWSSGVEEGRLFMESVDVKSAVASMGKGMAANYRGISCAC